MLFPCYSHAIPAISRLSPPISTQFPALPSTNPQAIPIHPPDITGQSVGIAAFRDVN